MLTPPETETVHHWTAITTGPCTPTPSAPVWRSDSGENAPVLPPGGYCFWSMAVRTYERAAAPSLVAPCRIEAIAQGARRLPEADGAISLVERPVGAAERPSWDLGVEAIAGCAPRRDPRRCGCPFSRGTSGPSEPEAYECAAPVDADLVAIGSNHTCAGRLGGSDVWCWGAPDRFGDTRTTPTVPPTRLLMADTRADALAQLAVNDDMVCALGISGALSCRGINLPLLTDGGLRLVAVDLAMGASVGCVLAATDVARGLKVYCWGGSGGAVEIAFDDGTQVDQIAVGARHGCIRRGRDVDCSPTDGAGAWVVDRVPGTYFDIVLGGRYACGQQVEAGYAYRCIDDLTTGLPLFTSEIGRHLTVSDETVCHENVSGLRCANWADAPVRSADLAPVTSPDVGDLLSGFAGPGLACGAAADGSGGLRCIPVGDSTAGRALLEAGSLASAAGTNLVCPYP